MKRRGWAANDTTVEVGEWPSPRSAVRRRGTVTVKRTVDDIMALAINVVQNGWSQEECRPDTGDVTITLPDALLREIYEALLKAGQRAAEKRMGEGDAPEAEAPVGRVVAADKGRSPGTPPSDWT